MTPQAWRALRGHLLHRLQQNPTVAIEDVLTWMDELEAVVAEDASMTTPATTDALAELALDAAAEACRDIAELDEEADWVGYEVAEHTWEVCVRILKAMLSIDTLPAGDLLNERIGGPNDA